MHSKLIDTNQVKRLLNLGYLYILAKIAWQLFLLILVAIYVTLLIKLVTELKMFL